MSVSPYRGHRNCYESGENRWSQVRTGERRRDQQGRWRQGARARRIRLCRLERMGQGCGRHAVDAAGLFTIRPVVRATLMQLITGHRGVDRDHTRRCRSAYRARMWCRDCATNAVILERRQDKQQHRQQVASGLHGRIRTRFRIIVKLLTHSEKHSLRCSTL